MTPTHKRVRDTPRSASQFWTRQYRRVDRYFTVCAQFQQVTCCLREIKGNHLASEATPYVITRLPAKPANGKSDAPVA